MPQFHPNFINIPDKIKEDPESFGLTKEDLRAVNSCNQIALNQNASVILTDEQWQSNLHVIRVIKQFKEAEQRRHRAILRVSPEFLGMFFIGDREIHVQLITGLPKDARFVGAWYKHECDAFDLCYESKEFAVVPEGEECPILPWPEIKELRKGN